MNIQDIEKRLHENFPNAAINVVDLSGDASKVQIEIASQLFQGLTRIQQHQKVMGVFQTELATGDLHALTIKTKTI